MSKNVTVFNRCKDTVVSDDIADLVAHLNRLMMGNVFAMAVCSKIGRAHV